MTIARSRDAAKRDAAKTVPETAIPRPARSSLKAWLTLKQTSTLMGVLGMALVVLVTAYLAWDARRLLFAEARDHAEQSAAYLADHALRLFEVSDLVLHATETALGDRSWDAIGNDPDLTSGMRRMDDMLPYVESVFVADATGRVRASTLDHPPSDYSVAGRSVFEQAGRERGDRLLIGGAIVGRVTKRPTFLVVRRRATPDGHFDGIVGTAMTLAYFTDYWARLDKRNDEQIALVRLGSGSVLARYPDPGTAEDTERLGTGVASAAAGGAPAGDFLPGPHEIGTFHRVGDLPVAVAVVFRDAAITRLWHQELTHLLPLAGVIILAIVAVMALAHRLARREDFARRQIETARAVLSASNVRLERRVVERTAELMETNREIQRFAYIVSHDLRAPLVNIMGFTSELQSLRDQVLGDPAALDAEGRARLHADFEEAFGFIGSSIDKMDRLIKAILALSRQGQRVFKPEPLDMDALMRSIADGVAHRAQAVGATIAVGPLPPLIADRIAVEQVFANLVDNAVKYLRPGVPGVIAIDGTASATTVTYTIKDNGRGIDPKDHERVFELFRRAGKQDQAGEGIGLANVRSLVRRLLGTITLDSGVGLGCVFSVTLPRTGKASGVD